MLHKLLPSRVNFLYYYVSFHPPILSSSLILHHFPCREGASSALAAALGTLDDNEAHLVDLSSALEGAQRALKARDSELSAAAVRVAALEAEHADLLGQIGERDIRLLFVDVDVS